MDKSTLFMKEYLVQLIEAKMDWGAGASWSNKDFEALSEHIFKATNKRLSVTTLKRIWGRAERVANPSATTLDILSEFVGYTDWRHFVRSYQPETTIPKSKPKPQHILIGIVLPLLLILGLIFGFFWKEDTAPSTDENVNNLIYDSSDFTFKSRPVAQGLPNSVVFEYNASAADSEAKIEIQQDWDARKRMGISKKDSVATSIYYYPGFFKSKMVIDDKIIKEEDVFITTDDWLGVIQRDGIPIYLKKEVIEMEDRIAISSETVTSHQLDPRTSNVQVSLYQVQDFGEVYSNEFEMSAVLQNTFKEGVSACQMTKVFLLYDGGAIGIPLAKKGCSAELNLLAFDQYIEGKKNDLSGFGVDFNQPVSLRCVAAQDTLKMFINDTTVYKMEIPQPAKKIKGMSFHFEGAGSVSGVTLSNANQVVYTSNATM